MEVPIKEKVCKVRRGNLTNLFGIVNFVSLSRRVLSKQIFDKTLRRQHRDTLNRFCGDEPLSNKFVCQLVSHCTWGGVANWCCRGRLVTTMVVVVKSLSGSFEDT